jgi:hypothetical protein
MTQIPEVNGLEDGGALTEWVNEDLIHSSDGVFHER